MNRDVLDEFLLTIVNSISNISRTSITGLPHMVNLFFPFSSSGASGTGAETRKNIYKIKQQNKTFYRSIAWIIPNSQKEVVLMRSVTEMATQFLSLRHFRLHFLSGDDEMRSKIAEVIMQKPIS